MNKKRIEISEITLRDLYLTQKLTMSQIAKLFGCNTEIIRRRLRAHGIPSRSSSEAALLQRGVQLSENELYALYVEQQLSTHEIAKRYNCSAATVRQRLRSFDIPVRSRLEAALASVGALDRLKDFCGSLPEKAYLIGFRIGDLTVIRRFSAGQAITVYGSSTRQEQIDLIRLLFEPYGYVRITQEIKNKHGFTEYHFICSLNSSFEFLVEKFESVPNWILSNDESFIAFFGGLVDAEGSFSLNYYNDSLSRGRFSIEMTSKELLGQCRERLMSLGISCSNLALHRRNGDINKHGIATRKDSWQFTIVQKAALLHLITLLGPYLNHAKRQDDMHRVRENIEWRNSDIFKAQVRQNRRNCRSSRA